MEKKLCRISLDRGNDHYLLTTINEGGQDVFNLNLTDGVNAWSGSVTKDELKVLARKIKMNLEEFVTETKRAFSQEDSGALHFQYQVKKVSDDEINFIWKKYIPSEKIKFQLGCSSLKMVDDPSEITKRICEYSIESSCSLQEKITSLESDNERLATERAAALKRLEKCVSMKEDMEKDMYENFVAVVNNKKDKIRSMRKEMEDIRCGIRDTLPTQGHSGARTHSTAAADNTSDEDSFNENDDKIHSSGSDYDTGDEQVVATSKRRLTKEPGNTGANSSLILDAEDATDSSILISAKRRKRTARDLKNKTPSKPVLPKPSSDPKIKSEQSSGGRASLRKSGSHTSDKSNKSSDNLDVDNLMDDL